jgi:hypothetical protein
MTTPAAGQRRFEAAALVAAVELRVDPGSGLERFSGPMVGGEAVLHIGARWAFAVRMQDGSLTARTTGGLNRDVGELSVEAQAHAKAGLSFSAGVCRRVYSTELARQRWSILHVGVEGRLPFIGGAIQAVARGALLPVVAVNGLDHPNTAYTVGTGLEYQHVRGTVGILYSLERYDFPAKAMPQRLEQVSALTVRGALRLGRGRTP